MAQRAPDGRQNLSTISVPVELYYRLLDYCAESSRTQGWVRERALRDWLDAHEHDADVTPASPAA